MFRGTTGTRRGWGLAAALAWALLPAAGRAQNYAMGPPSATFGAVGGAGCATCGVSIPTTRGTKCCHLCCPHYHHCAEGPVHICFHHCCAKPVCNPCDVPHWGVWQKCWSPWPWPPDWGHCPTPPPAAQVVLNPATHYNPALTYPPMPVPGTLTPRGNNGNGYNEEGPRPRPTEGIRPGL
jgi:hypothetical protein